MLAMRLARAYTGKDVICKVQGHFHGWHDYATLAMQPPYDEPISAGVPRGVRDSVVGVPARDIAALRALLDQRHDIAGVIMVADGAGTPYLQAVRDLTTERGVVFLLDEVVTGFRYAPGGAQEYYGVTPDLTTLAKILAGGLPGGAIAGRADIMARFLQRDNPDWTRHQRVPIPARTTPTHSPPPPESPVWRSCATQCPAPGHRDGRPVARGLPRGTGAARYQRQSRWGSVAGAGQFQRAKGAPTYAHPPLPRGHATWRRGLVRPELHRLGHSRPGRSRANSRRLR